ncbi:MAG: hypothetical protein MPN21_10845 [Thermoanaerobaculia bacterium]|nr:hypothetical protein [Thermoanaerobaculia bacterium]
MTAETEGREAASLDEMGDVAAFVRTVRESVNRLVNDADLADELLASLAVEASDSLDVMVHAQRVLVRVLSYERATLGEPLCAADIEAFLHQERLSAEDATRLLYELSLSNGRSWPAVNAVACRRAELDPHMGGGPSDPVLKALRLAASSSIDLRLVSFDLRHAAVTAPRKRLGFLRLVLDVADAAGELDGETLGPTETPGFLEDPFLRRESYRYWVDLLARSSIYQADRARRFGRLDLCDDLIASLPDLLSAGTGDADLLARVAEVKAGRDWETGDHPSALAGLRNAEDVLIAAEIPRSDPDERSFREHRLVELRLKQAVLLSADPMRRKQARDLLASLVESTSAELDPLLRLRTFLAAARIELDLARQAVAERSPLGQAPEPPSHRALSSYAEAWLTQSQPLDQAASWLVAAEPLLEGQAAERHAEHLWLRGQARLLSDRQRAADDLRKAIAAFRRLGDTAMVDRVSVDLIVCGVLGGALGDELDNRSEPLRLFQLLATRI